MSELKSLNKTKQKEFIQKQIKNLSPENKIKFWIKTLLSSYGTIPEIIKTVDKIIEMQASTTSFMTDVYNKEKTTFCQVEKIIDLSERKSKLLNIHLMTKQILKNLPENESDFIEKRFCYNWTIEDLANEFNISIRTVFRKIDKIIDMVAFSLKKQNWSLSFLESQVKNEDWLKERYHKQILDYFKSVNFQSKSSSES